MNKLPLSVIILVHSPDTNIQRTLESVTFAEEIVIIDNNSGISWDSLQNQYNLAITPHPTPITNFAEVRNAAVDKASHDWVLFLDSDEALKKESQPHIVAVLESPTASGAVAYRSDVFYGKELQYGEAGQQHIIRMGKKGALKFSGTVHETASVQGELVYTQIQILHFAHPTISEFIEDVSRYAQVVAQTRTTGLVSNFVQMIVFPLGKLLYGLIIQGGVMDGWRGVVYAACMSLHSLLVRIYRYETLAQAHPSPQR